MGFLKGERKRTTKKRTNLEKKRKEKEKKRKRKEKKKREKKWVTKSNPNQIKSPSQEDRSSCTVDARDRD